MYCCDALCLAVHGVPTPSLTGLLGQTSIARIALLPPLLPEGTTTTLCITLCHRICSALAAGSRGPMIVNRARNVVGGLYRFGDVVSASTCATCVVVTL